MPIIQTRGPKTGVCNICGESGPLTADHIPPKSAIRVRDMLIQDIISHLSIQDKIGEKKKGKQAQGGVSFRSLCARCNNSILGGACDKQIGDISEKISNHLESKIILPRNQDLVIPCYPQKLSRAVLGHLKAVGIERYKMGKGTEEFREYLMDSTKPLPEFINIYYWVFPFNKHVVIRDAGMTDLKINEPVTFWAMKFYPLAFLVTFDEPAGYNFGNYDLGKYRFCEFDEIVDLPIPTSPEKIKHQYWPEAPDDNRIVFYGQAGFSATMKPIKCNF